MVDFTKDNNTPIGDIGNDTGWSANPSGLPSQADITNSKNAMKEPTVVANLFKDTLTDMGREAEKANKKMDWSSIKKLRSEWKELAQEIKDGSIKMTAEIEALQKSMAQEMKNAGLPTSTSNFDTAVATATSGMKNLASSSSGLVGMSMPAFLAEAGPWGLAFGLMIMAKNLFREEAGKTNLAIARMSGGIREAVDTVATDLDSLSFHWKNTLSNENLIRIKSLSDVIYGIGHSSDEVVDSLVALDTVIGTEIGSTMEAARQKAVLFNQDAEDIANSLAKVTSGLSGAGKGTDIWARQVYELHGRLGAIAPHADLLLNTMKKIGDIGGGPLGAGQAQAAVGQLYTGFQGASLPALAVLGQMLFPEIAKKDPMHAAFLTQQMIAGIKDPELQGRNLEQSLPTMIGGILGKLDLFSHPGNLDAAMLLQVPKILGLKNLSPEVQEALQTIMKTPGVHDVSSFVEAWRSPAGAAAGAGLTESIKKAIQEAPSPWTQAVKDLLLGLLSIINGAVTIIMAGMFYIGGQALVGLSHIPGAGGLRGVGQALVGTGSRQMRIGWEQMKVGLQDTVLAGEIGLTALPGSSVFMDALKNPDIANLLGVTPKETVTWSKYLTQYKKVQEYKKLHNVGYAKALEGMGWTEHRTDDGIEYVMVLKVNDGDIKTSYEKANAKASGTSGNTTKGLTPATALHVP